jgi:hypothetical protein
MGTVTTAGSGNWSSTTPDAPWPGGTVPGEGDNVTIANTHTVTIDQNVTVGNDSTTAAITINSGGKLQVLSTVAASYTLTCKGDLVVNGTLEIGTTTNPIPSTKTFTILLNYSGSLSAGEFGMKIGEAAAATVTIQGASKTYYATTIDTDANDTDTHIHSAVNTGWKDNDELVLAPTSRTYSESELLVMNGDASDDVINFDSPAALAYDHSGTGQTAAELVNLTRNIKIGVYNTSYPSYITVKNASTVIDVDWCRFDYIGANASNKYSITFLTNALSAAAAFRYCAFTNGHHGIYNDIDDNRLDIQDSIIYNTTQYGVYIADRLVDSTLSNLYIIKTGTNNAHGIYITDKISTTTISNIYTSGTHGTGVYLFTSGQFDASGITASNWVSHSNADRGMMIYGHYGLSLDTLKSYRNNSFGLCLDCAPNTIITAITLFGNTNYNIYLSGTSLTRITGGTVDSDATYSTAYGVCGANMPNYGITIEGVTFGGTTPHSTADINPVAGSGDLGITLIKCTLSSPDKVYQYYKMLSGQVIRSHDHDNTEGNHITWKRQGIIEEDTSVYKTASPSEKLTPYYAAEKLESNSKYFTCADGATKTVSVWVRKAAAYDGDEPRLILKRNYAAGVTTDTVLDTMTAAVETWEQLSGACTAPSEDTVYEVVVDCADGTAAGHYINVDGWTVA